MHLNHHSSCLTTFDQTLTRPHLVHTVTNLPIQALASVHGSENNPHNDRSVQEASLRGGAQSLRHCIFDAVDVFAALHSNRPVRPRTAISGAYGQHPNRASIVAAAFALVPGPIQLADDDQRALAFVGALLGTRRSVHLPPSAATRGSEAARLLTESIHKQ